MKDKMSDVGVFKCQQRSSHCEGSASIAAVKELWKGGCLRGENEREWRARCVSDTPCLCTYCK